MEVSTTLWEEARAIPVAYEADLCVIGGSCTGVFAAVRAARLGLRVAVIENNGFFGGVATAGLVNIWHSLRDVPGDRQIIGGLTAEVLARLAQRDAVVHDPSDYYVLNTEELKIELDELVREARVHPFLHARFVSPMVEDGRLTAVVIEDKSGRRAIRAALFIDASGDGDLIHRMGLRTTRQPELQPPTACAVLEGLAKLRTADPEFQLDATVFNPAYPEALPSGFLWTSTVSQNADLTMVAGTRVNNADCSDADVLTCAEMASRAQVRAMLDVLRNHLPQGREVRLRELPAYIGIRETRHAACLHTVTEKEVLEGYRYADAIANGTYRVDVHHSDKPGITFRYLHGVEQYLVPGQAAVESRWLPEGQATAHYYQVPYRALVPQGTTNVLIAGRLIDADAGAYGALRVMVNCNQMGEAVGVACALAMEAGCGLQDVPPEILRAHLREGGSIIM